MADRTYRIDRTGIHPLHAFLLISSVPLFLGGLLSDWAYSSSYEIQWTNFASWLIAGALVFAGFALLWAFIELLRPMGIRDVTRTGCIAIGRLSNVGTKPPEAEQEASNALGSSG